MEFYADLYLTTVAQAGVGSYIINILINAGILLLAAYLLKGVEINGFVTAIILAVVLGFLNSTLGNILSFFGAPITFVTLGLFSLVIDAIIIKIADWFMDDFKVKGFVWAFVLAVVITLLNYVVGMFLN